MKSEVQLPPNHRRVLSVTAARVEKELDEMERLLRYGNPNRATSTVRVAYSREQRERLLETIRQMRQANEEMFAELRLEASEFNEERIIRAKAAHLWTVLVDSLSAKTRGYGELPADAARDVDRHVENLLTIVRNLLHLCTP